MGRIKKAAGPKHEATLSPALADFVSDATKLPLVELPSHLRSFPFRWPYPRGDLYHWITLLDLFDTILEDFVREYGLKDGPQTQVFGTRLLIKGVTVTEDASVDRSCTRDRLNQTAFGEDGDRELVASILGFSRILLENCGNRSLYASSEHLGHLLNTTSLPLLLVTLRLASRLAIRYHHSRQRGANQQLNNTLLTNHYNIDLERVQKLADVFTRAGSPGLATSQSTNPASPSKSREKIGDKSEQGLLTSSFGDILLAVREDTSPVWTVDSSLISRWCSVNFSFQRPQYHGEAAIETALSNEPSTPTPGRRTAGSSRPSRGNVTENVSTQPSTAVLQLNDRSGSIQHIVEVPSSLLRSTSLEEILKFKLPEVPQEFHYEFLNQLRAAKYMSESLYTRRKMTAARILALTNLAYVYQETTFQQKILKPDSDEPKRVQIVQQLAELVHPPDNDSAGIPLWLKTIAIGALEALSKHKDRANDVCSALSVNVSHGILLFILRKTAADLASDSAVEDSLELDDWQEALLSLLDALPSSASRTADSLVGAGLLEILVDVLRLRTEKAERIHHKVLTFLNSLVHSVRDAFQAFVNAKGLDAISDLIAWEVSSSISRVKNGKGLSDRFKSRVTDYEMPYFQQQTLRWLFKFVNHMMTNGSANFDRLLRNLIDSPQLLAGLRDVLANGKIFGSTIWSGAVNILSSFIHNEPTSYAVIAEAGLSKSFLDSIAPNSAMKPSQLCDLEESSSTIVRKSDVVGSVSVTIRGREASADVDREYLVNLSPGPTSGLAKGILPATDAISAIPSAFGAICLNSNGLDMFLKSGALECFFEIFESPEHVKSMAAEANLPKNLGQHFDELVRHHPRLKLAIMQSVILMCARLSYHCQKKANEDSCGARLYPPNDNSTSPAHSSSQISSVSKVPHDGDDVKMEDPSSQMAHNEEEAQIPDIPTYIGVAAKFLSGFFDNQSLCGGFIYGGGLEFILDLAKCPGLPYNFNNQSESQDLSAVLHTLVEHKPHLVLPSLISSSLEILAILEPLMSHKSQVSFFDHYTREHDSNTQQGPEVPGGDGTTILKALVSIHTLSNVLQEAFMAVPFGARSQHTLFSQVNLTDVYIRLSKSFGRLYRVCVWEEILLQNSLSSELKESTRVRGYGMGSDEADEVFGFINNNSDQQITQATDDPSDEFNTRPASSGNEGEKLMPKMNNTARSKNVQSIRFLLSQVPSSITPFLQGLGRSLVSKRRAEPYQRQNAYMVADSLATVALDHLRFETPHECSEVKDRFAYWIVALTSLTQLLIEGPLERPHSQCLTLVLLAFRNQGGLRYVNEMTSTFFDKIQELTEETCPQPQLSNSVGLLNCLYGGMKLILSLYGQITSAKYIAESSQSQALTTPERDRSSPYFFSPAQFLVELRVSVITAVRPVWDSSSIDKSSSSILKCIVDILKTVFEAEQEHGALTSSSKSAQQAKPDYRQFLIAVEKEASLLEKNLPADLVKEALYRCYNNRDSAEEYCDIRCRQIGAPSLSIPAYDAEQTQDSTRPQNSRDTIPDATTVLQTSEVNGNSNNTGSSNMAPNSSSLSPGQVTAQPSAQDGQSQSTGAPDTDVMADSIDNILNLSEGPRPQDVTPSSVERSAPALFRSSLQGEFTVTVEELDDIRGALRKNFIGRILEILSCHDDMSFDLADLIITAASKAQDAESLRKEIGETLVQSLISFQHKEDFRPTGKNIAAYANLLAIVIQEKDFYEAAVDEIKENMESLLNFVKVFPDQSADEKSPWVAQVLLIIEKLLAEDVQPEQIKWTPPNLDNIDPEHTIVQAGTPLISVQDKTRLFDSILDILPRVGKDQSLALSAIRILVILTRNHNIASRLGEKKNLQRLFVVPKQLAGLSNNKFQSAFLLVLRHMLEDDETIKNIMRTEIRNCFISRPQRPVDTTTYVRNMHALVLRAPETFLNVTNQLLKIDHYDQNARPQILTLKESKMPLNSEDVSNKPENDTPLGLEVPGEDGDVQPSTEPTGMVGERTKLAEQKFPLSKYPDGVVHYLLSQLLSYKDVDDQNVNTQEKDASVNAPYNEVEMTNYPGPVNSMDPHFEATRDSKKSDKSEYKPEQHPIYMYRCFLLQCLSELLMSYSRAKIEFLNFSRKTDSKVLTPSKPRSGILNYILHSLVPIDTLERSETISFRKSVGTSNWAMSVVVALCLKTHEAHFLGRVYTSHEETDAELQFVQKFVLENTIKVFKDVNASNEPQGVRYARLLSLADLFSRFLSGKVTPIPATPYAQEPQAQTIKGIAKIMFEKNFIAALTSSIADIDLTFPNSRRAVKYILRPLRTLTQMAIQLSESSELSSSSAQTDEDEISSATSLSDDGDEREETPDLFRHSTLGILDPGGREDESSSGSGDEDEDMYGDDGYDDGIEYEEEIERDNDEVISDEDEELGTTDQADVLPGDVDMDVEVVLEDDDATDEEISEDSDDMDEEVEIIDEINDDNDSMSDGEIDDWDDEGDEDGNLDLHAPFMLNPISTTEFSLPHDERRDHGDESTPARDLVLDLPSGGSAEDEGPIGGLEMDVEDGRYIAGLDVDLSRREDDLEEEDEEDLDDDDDDDDDIVYPDYDGDDGEADDPSPWGFGADDEPPVRGVRSHPHSHVRRIMSPWSMFTPGYSGSDRVPAYRAHGGQPVMRGPDDGLNPLLQRPGVGSQGNRRATPVVTDAGGSLSDFIHLLGSSRHRHDGVVSLLNGMMTTVGVAPPFGTSHHGALHLHLDSQGGLIPFPRDLQALVSSTRNPGEPNRSHREDSTFIPAFFPVQTPNRWSEEARLLFGHSYNDKTQRVVNSILKLLVPPALEELRVQKEKDAEERKQREQEEKERDQRLAKERAEKEERESKEREEREATEVLSTETQRVEHHSGSPHESSDAMEGVERTATEIVETEESLIVNADEDTSGEASSGAGRVRATFRGREVDITHLGIDLEYLEALPEDLREEVLMQQLAEHRSQAAVSGDAPAGVDREFLDALPPDIRQEILQQEAQERRRREQEETRRQASASGAPTTARAEEMDAASFLASLDPGLRSAVLLDQDEDMISQLPAAIAAEARALGAERITHRWGNVARNQRNVPQASAPNQDSNPETSKRPPRKQIVQMLDKAGVATLLRLLFIPQQGSSHDYLHVILENASRNSQNRSEILSILLSILQEGSSDSNAIERSFTHLSLRARQSTGLKAPQSVKKQPTGSTNLPLGPEMTPMMAIQQCLKALVHLTDANAHVPAFFLSEQDQVVGLKTKSSKKGKGRESRDSKFAINILLGLLDRRLITDSAACMEYLSSLMQNISRPLMLFRKDMDSSKAMNKGPVSTEVSEPHNDETEANSAQISAPAGVTQTEQPDGDSSVATSTSVAAAPKKDGPFKKMKNFQLPLIPEQNYRLVVSILGARECSSKTFRDTLSTINNLSTIPGAKEVFGKELVKVSQQLGDTITRDLDLLVSQIQGATSSDDVHGMALSKFSPSSSNQAKFLRVLTALDYLFDPNRISIRPEDESTSSDAKEDLVTSLYESSAFEPLWNRLSECLRFMRQRENMLNTATVLLPLVEALMVVCKNTTLKETDSKPAKEFNVSSPVPESGMKSLFFRFTEEHRKILNDLVRNNPRLMSGTFSLLVKNPKVLEFDNKRNFFTRQLHSRTDLRHSQPSLQLSIRRDQTFLDSYRSLYFKTPEEMKYGKLSIRFHGEEGVDAGGVTREWFQTMSRQMFNADYALFVPVASDRTTFHPNPSSHINEEHLFYFKFIGRIIGKALYEGRALDCHFSRAVYKRILGKSVSVKDMETLDLEYYKSLLWMLENDISDIITETFSIETEVFGKTEVIDLIPNGRNIPVTEENKQEYVQLVVEHRLTGSVKEQLEEFLKGFHDIVPSKLISIFNEQELELLISGLPDIDVDDWKNNTEYHNYSASSAQIQWFWRAVRSFDKEEQAKLLQFVTGTAKVPLNGFKELEGMNGFSRFNIHRDYGNKNRLPSSHTCFNQLDLPEYDDYETLRKQLYTAMTAGSDYFGFA